VAFSPFPFGNAPQALVIVMIALGYLEEDGALSMIAALAAMLLLALPLSAFWTIIREAQWLEKGG
jgi:hypothetical protein